MEGYKAVKTNKEDIHVQQITGPTLKGNLQRQIF